MGDHEKWGQHRASAAGDAIPRTHQGLPPPPPPPSPSDTPGGRKALGFASLNVRGAQEREKSEWLDGIFDPRDGKHTIHSAVLGEVEKFSPPEHGRREVEPGTDEMAFFLTLCHLSPRYCAGLFQGQYDRVAAVRDPGMTAYYAVLRGDGSMRVVSPERCLRMRLGDFALGHNPSEYALEATRRWFAENLPAGSGVTFRPTPPPPPVPVWAPPVESEGRTEMEDASPVR